MERLWTSGSSVSLMESGTLIGMKDVVSVRCARSLWLVTASGDQLPILRHIRAYVKLGEFNVMHDFVVLDSLVTPVILGIDFLQQNGLVLDFTCTPVMDPLMLAEGCGSCRSCCFGSGYTYL